MIYGVLVGMWCCGILISWIIVWKKEGGVKKRGKLKNVYEICAPLSEQVVGQWLCKTRLYQDYRLETTLQRLAVVEDVACEKKKYFVDKTSKIIFICGVVLLLGLYLNESEQQKMKTQIKTIERAEPGLGDSSYELLVEQQVQDDTKGKKGENEKISFQISEEEYSEKEKKERVKNVAEKLAEEILGENKKLNHVTKDLKLITQLDEVSIMWDVGNQELIDYQGMILTKDIQVQGEAVDLLATLKFYGYEEVITYTITLYPQTDSMDTMEGLREYIQTSGEKTEKTIELPTEWNGKKLTFYPVVEHYAATIVCVGIIICILLFFYQDKELDKQLERREKQMLLDYGQIVLKLSLLYQAGLSITGAWDRIVDNYEKEKKACGEQSIHYAYEEMKLANQRIKDGVAVGQCMGEFGRRCNVNCYMKLGNLLEQNIQKGTKGLIELLEAEMIHANEIHKEVVRKRGEEAGMKLLVPMIGMLVISIVIVVVPSFLSLQLG